MRLTAFSALISRHWIEGGMKGFVVLFKQEDSKMQNWEDAVKPL